MSRIGVLESSSFTQAHLNTAPPDLSRVENRLTRLEQESARARAAEEEAIGFHHLGFKSKMGSKAWLALNAPIDQFGFIVDFHTVMEHIHQQITGVDSSSSLEKLYKLRLKTLLKQCP